MNAAKAILPTSSDRSEWTPEEAARVEAAGLVFTFPDYHEKRGERVLAPRPVIEKFFHLAETTGLNPLARQIYCIPRLSKGVIEWTVQTGIDGFRVVAERSRQYAGRKPFQWLTESGEWVEVFIRGKHGDHPLAARVAILRHDWTEPLVAVATWDEYVQTTSKGDVTSMWKTRGPGQLAKCAEALGLRSAFPQDLSGLYTEDEMPRGAALDEEGEGAQEVEIDPRSRGRSRVAALVQKPAEEPDPVVVAESVAEPPTGRTASMGADPAGEEPEPMEACRNCRRATPVTELMESPERDLCAECMARFDAEDAADRAADARGI